MFSFKHFLHDTNNIIVEINQFDLNHSLWLEAVSDISKIQDAYWEEELPTQEEIRKNIKKAPAYAIYRFNVLGDGCGEDAHPQDPCNCEKPPHTGISTCYKVVFSGRPEDGVRVSFSRGIGSDKFSDVRLSYDENGKITPVGANVFVGVKRAFQEYIEKLNPVSIDWESVSRDTYAISQSVGSKKDKNVRDNIYNFWSAKNLFPNKFVGIQGYWLKRDVYDKQLVPLGFPEVPDTVTYMITDKFGNRVQKTDSVKEDSTASVKKAAMDNMNQQIVQKVSNWQKLLNNFKTNLKSENEKNRKQELEQKIKEKTSQLGFQRAKEDEYNPQKIQVDDIVKIKSASGINFFIHAIVRNFYATINERQLYAEVQLQSNPSSNKFDGEFKKIPVKELSETKSFENDIKYYKNLLFEKIKEHNLDIGDKVASNFKSPNVLLQLLGVVQKLFLHRNLDGSISLKVKILWDDHAKSILKNKQNDLVFASTLEKIDPRSEMNIKSKQRDFGIQQRIEKNKQRISPIKLQNDTEAESFGLKIGDKVKITSGLYAGKTGEITLFQKSSTGLIAHVASADIPNIRVRAKYLAKIEGINIGGDAPISANENTFYRWFGKRIEKENRPR